MASMSKWRQETFLHYNVWMSLWSWVQYKALVNCMVNWTGLRTLWLILSLTGYHILLRITWFLPIHITTWWGWYDTVVNSLALCYMGWLLDGSLNPSSWKTLARNYLKCYILVVSRNRFETQQPCDFKCWCNPDQLCISECEVKT